MNKFNNFFKKSIDHIVQATNNTFQQFIQDMKNTSTTQIEQNKQKCKTEVLQQSKQQKNQKTYNKASLQKISFDHPLQNIDLQQSKLITSMERQGSKSMKRSKISQHSPNNSRIKQIQLEKKRILEQLRKLDGQIAEIKQQKQVIEENSMQQSQFHKKMKIFDDIQAKKQAQQLIRQLHIQKRQIQQKKRKNQERQLSLQKLQEEQRLRQKQEMQKKFKQQKRMLIERRMQQQKKKKVQRLTIDKQSNQLIAELKKQQKFQKQTSLIPKKIQQIQHKKKLIQKRSMFNASQIQQHQKKYSQLKSKQKQFRRERLQSVKVATRVQKYAKNVWNQKIQEQDTRKKQQQRIKQMNRKIQLQKRMKYGDLVKNLFLSKNKKKQEQTQRISKQQSEQKVEKPQTPNTVLPMIPKSDHKRQNQTEKRFKNRIISQQKLQLKTNININDKSASVIQNKKSRMMKQIREKDPQQVQKLQKQKIRQLQLRKQTKERLKKIQSQVIQPIKPQKVKYENYIPKLKLKKKAPEQQWKRIMDNQNLSKQQKYQEMLSKATSMQNQAKIKQDLRKNGDQDAVNLYIGSIQAKLALLERF